MQRCGRFASRLSISLLERAEHILDSKAADIDPNNFIDHYERALVELVGLRPSCGLARHCL
jgi:non-homologous end joining protein Ku